MKMKGVIYSLLISVALVICFVSPASGNPGDVTVTLNVSFSGQILSLIHI